MSKKGKAAVAVLLIGGAAYAINKYSNKFVAMLDGMSKSINTAAKTPTMVPDEDAKKEAADSIMTEASYPGIGVSLVETKEEGKDELIIQISRKWYTSLLSNSKLEGDNLPSGIVFRDEVNPAYVTNSILHITVPEGEGGYDLVTIIVPVTEDDDKEFYKRCVLDNKISILSVN